MTDTTDKTYNIFDFSIDAGRFAVTGSRREIRTQLANRIDEALKLFEQDVTSDQYRSSVAAHGIDGDNKIEIQLSAKLVYGAEAAKVAEARIAAGAEDRQAKLDETVKPNTSVSGDAT